VAYPTQPWPPSKDQLTAEYKAYVERFWAEAQVREEAARQRRRDSSLLRRLWKKIRGN
jgi:hypothetical protein